MTDPTAERHALTLLRNAAAQTALAAAAFTDAHARQAAAVIEARQAGITTRDIMNITGLTAIPLTAILVAAGLAPNPTSTESGLLVCDSCGDHFETGSADSLADLLSQAAAAGWTHDTAETTDHCPNCQSSTQTMTAE